MTVEDRKKMRVKIPMPKIENLYEEIKPDYWLNIPEPVMDGVAVLIEQSDIQKEMILHLNEKLTIVEKSFTAYIEHLDDVIKWGDEKIMIDVRRNMENSQTDVENTL